MVVDQDQIKRLGDKLVQDGMITQENLGHILKLAERVKSKKGDK
jgi:hypothetical protein